MKKIGTILAAFATALSSFAETEPAKSEIRFSPETFAGIFQSPNTTRLFRSNLRDVIFKTVSVEGGIEIEIDFLALENSDFSQLLSGVSVEKNLDEALFVSADNMAAWASATKLDQNGIEALSRMFKQSATERSRILAEAIINSDIFNPGMGRYVEAFEAINEIALISKSDAGIDGLFKKAQGISKIFEENRNEQPGTLAPVRETHEEFEIITMPFGMHSVHSYVCSAATIANGFEIVASGDSPEKAKALLLKYASIVKKGKPVGNNLSQKLGDAHKALTVQPSKLIGELQNTFLKKNNIEFSYHYDLDGNFRLALPKNANLDPVDVRFYFYKDRVTIRTMLTMKNADAIFPFISSPIQPTRTFNAE